jgi:sigma-B regulation protein RsbU (phosphoserine phosphatase)
VCAPILLAGDVAAYLYLDNRGARGARSQQSGDFTGYAVGLARLASMALANLRRLELEREYARLDAELIAAAEAQKWIFPAREGSEGRLSYIGQTRPGRRLGGDFFDVAQLGPGRLAVALGDVSGKGAGAAVLMTASQGFLHASLREHGDPGRAVSALNDFIHPRRPSNRFLTLWVGVFDGQAGTLRYVDAGHGYGFALDHGGVVDRLTSEGGLVGIEPGTVFESVSRSLRAEERVVVVSDGLVEQPGAKEGAAAFGVEALVASLHARAPEGKDEVDALFDAVEAHAGGPALADDATALVVRWSGRGADG